METIKIQSVYLPTRRFKTFQAWFKYVKSLKKSKL